MKIYMMRFCHQKMSSMQGFMMDVADTLENLQHLVRGMIQTVPIEENARILIVCNENGKFFNMPVNRILLADDGEGEFEIIDSFNGDCFALRFDDNEGFCSIEREDIPIIKKYVRPVSYTGNTFEMVEEDNCITLDDYKRLADIEQIKSGVFLKLLDRIHDKYSPIEAGAYFKVSGVDDAGQIHGSWLAPYRSSIAINPDIDSFEIVQGGFEEIKKQKIKEFYSKFSGGVDKSQEFDYGRFEEIVSQFYDYQITEKQMKEMSWKIYFEHIVKQ